MLLYAFITGFIACYTGAALLCYIAIDRAGGVDDLAATDRISRASAASWLAFASLCWPYIMWKMVAEAEWR